MIRIRANVGVSSSGELAIDEATAHTLVREISAQLPAKPISAEMLTAGVDATWLNIGYPKRFLDSEIEGIVRRVYAAMRPLEG